MMLMVCLDRLKREKESEKELMNLGKKGRDKERAERMKERKKANEEINA